MEKPLDTPASGPAQVLVVEDEPRLRDLLLSAIPDMGFAAKGARSGEEAIRCMESRPAAIIILDLNLPGMTGLEFCEIVRERWPQTRVVIMTGFGDLATAQQAMRLDVVDFLTKPASLGELEQALDRARRRLPARTPALAEQQLTAEPPRSPQATLEEIERNHILHALQRNHGNRAATAAELGISVRTLYYRLAEFQKQGFLS